jgi:acetyl-CoA carboxylase biotin carboxyl carrier protein
MAVSRPKVERGRLDLPEIKKLIELIERSPITEFELVDKDLKVRISKNGASSSTVNMMTSPQMAHAVVSAPAVAAAPAAEPVAALPEAKSPKLLEVKAPMVGTFYRAPSPDAEPYVRVGDSVEPGKVLCIVEAMKLMNEIECEVRGRIVEILMENAQPVEFGQPLFRIDASGV